MVRKKTLQKRISTLLALLPAILCCFGVPHAGAEEAGFTCRTADEWNTLFDRRDKPVDGWLAADEVFSELEESLHG